MPDAPAKDASSFPLPVPAASAASAGVTPVNDAGAVGSPAKEAPAKDIVLLGPPTADGAGVHVLRARPREEKLEIGELRPLENGRPITGEVLTLAPRKDNPRVCDVEDSYVPPATHKGPARVATSAYRQGWDDIFGAKPPTPSAAN
jgi:hypothetical protein